MQDGLEEWSSSSSSSSSLCGYNNNNNDVVWRMIERMAGESAVVIFSVSSCCMCHVIKRLFMGMGVSPTVHELDLLPSGHLLHKAAVSPPLVFVGGKLVGPTDAVMASHINGTLVPLLKDAGALWL